MRLAHSGAGYLATHPGSGQPDVWSWTSCAWARSGRFRVLTRRTEAGRVILVLLVMLRLAAKSVPGMGDDAMRGGAMREKRKTVTAPETRSRQPKPLDAGIFQPEISSFRLHLAAEGKAAKTVRTYTEAVRWFAAAHLLRRVDRMRWEEVGKQDVQEWVAWLLRRYSEPDPL
jgi:hypothetical protein